MDTKDVLLLVVTSNKFIQEKKNYMFICKVVIKENMKPKEKENVNNKGFPLFPES